MIDSKPFSFRYEAFGGIIHLSDPCALLYVDQTFVRELGFPESPLWTEGAVCDDTLSAPTEVHLSLSESCGASCCGCGDEKCDGSRKGSMEDDSTEALHVLSELARIKVFHLTLVGVEGAQLERVLEIAHVARGLGMVPNLETDGENVYEENAHEFTVFGQVNVGLDEIGKEDAESSSVRAIQAMRRLRRRDVRVGINCVVSRRNFDSLDDLFELAKTLGIARLELRRLKPTSGPGLPGSNSELELTREQAWEFLPRITELAKSHEVPITIDCSFTPFLYAHDPDPDLLDNFGVTGCRGGNVLASINGDGEVTACAFTPSEGRNVDDIKSWWKEEETFFSFRHWEEAAPEPCRSCRFLKLCRGGCHAVSKTMSGDLYSPDPGCPIVRDFFASPSNPLLI